MEQESLETESESLPRREGIEKTERIEVLEREFARGNYRLVREGASALLASENAEEARMAKEFLAKTSPDPWLLALVGLSFLFFTAITIYVYAVGR